MVGWNTGFCEQNNHQKETGTGTRNHNNLNVDRPCTGQRLIFKQNNWLSNYWWAVDVTILWLQSHSHCRLISNVYRTAQISVAETEPEPEPPPEPYNCSTTRTGTGTVILLSVPVPALVPGIKRSFIRVWYIIFKRNHSRKKNVRVLSQNQPVSTRFQKKSEWKKF